LKPATKKVNHLIRGSDADEYLGEPVGDDPSERQPSPNE